MVSPRSEPVRHGLILAAVGQLADEGMRGLTHRKVEQRAGVAQGSVKYHFGTLDRLIAAVLTHMVEEQIVDVVRADDDEQAALMSGVVPASLRRRLNASAWHLWSQSDLNRARFELYLHASRHPELQQVIADARGRFVRAIADALETPNAEAGARLICATMDGLLLDQLSAPHPDVEADTPSYMLAGAVAAQTLPAIDAALAASADAD